MAKVPERDWLLKFADLAEAYRTSFREVQNQLRNADMGRIPAWCFAVDRMEIEEVDKLSPELGAAERSRRKYRVALHALAELIALTGDTKPASSEAVPANLVESLEGDADAELDRFITVINLAKSGGVIYINGTFEPVGSLASLPPESDRPEPKKPPAKPASD